ncbi:mediator of DNA damage checkpoint protein 1 isoform X1 [Anas platyrhynchos]|uniref:mediator of DNA damage checkpoint protein 1 isoform X1 n=1 Tax=Anas platyrhynchos TaxID=8839 RepID=UPI003AF25A5E
MVAPPPLSEDLHRPPLYAPRRTEPMGAGGGRGLGAAAANGDEGAGPGGGGAGGAMQRRRHRGLVTTGGTGQGPEPRHHPPVTSDSEDDETCPAAGSTTLPQVVPESDPEEPDACSEIRVLRKRRPTPNLGLCMDSTPSPLDPDVAGPKKLRLCPKTPPAPDAGSKTAVSGVRPQNRSPNPKGQVDPDVRQLGGIESDTDDEAHPKSALFHPNRHPAAPEVSGDPNVEERGPNPGAGGAQNGRWMLTVDSDTDVEEADLPPSVRHPKIRQKAQKVPKTPGGEMKPPNPGSKNGIQALVVDSDTDVEDGRANLDVGLAKSPQTTENIPKITMESPHPAVKGPQKEEEPLTTGSDTDVEEDGANPNVVRLPTPQMTQSAPKTPNIEVETPNPGADGRQEEKWALVVDSDTDVEEEPSDPGGGDPKSRQITQNAPRNLEVGMETPNPRPGEPQRGHEMLTVDSDTDVEEDGLNPGVGCPKTHRMAPKPHDDSDVAIKTPNPDLKGPQNRGQNLELDSDTDIEGEDPNPDIPGLRNPKTPQNAQKDPTVVMETPNPDVGRDLNVDRNTGVEDSGVVTDFGAVRGGQGTPGDPDVGLATPNPEVSPPVTPQSGSDTDVEEVAPTPYVQSLRSKTRPRNPDVDTTMGSETGVGLTDPKCHKPAPKRQGLPPESRSDGDVEGEVPKQPDLAPKTDAEDLNPEDEVLQRNPQTSATGGDTDVAPAGLAPKSPIPAPNLGLGGDAARGSRSAEATPGGNTSVEVAESETEDDPDLFLEPTQNFLPPPVTEDAALGWDPEEATQLFCHPKLEEEEEEKEEEEEEKEEEDEEEEEKKKEEEEEKKEKEKEKEDEEVKKKKEEEEEEEDEEVKKKEEEEEEPPQDTPATRVPPAEPVLVTPAQEEGAGTSAAPGGAVTQGPRRSQRLARGQGGRAPAGGGASAVGGASGGGGASQVRGGANQARGGALPCPAPPRRSPRLRARPPSPAEPPAKKGRGQEEPRPPPRTRPKRSGHAPSQIREEEEPPEGARVQLRPRGGAGSSSPKVLFTGVVASPDMEVALGSLGGSMATSVFDCTHLVTDRVRRTVKFLCAVARGIPIVTPKWLHESARSGRVLAPGSFLVRDSQQERHFGFSLSQALSRARRHPLLQGYEVHVTPSVRPEPEQMRDIVTCSGGTFLPTMPCTYGPQRLVISCGEDSGCWAPALSARLPLASAELLLTGLLRQRLQLQDFLLAPPDTPPGPSGVPQDPPPKSPQPPPASPRRLRAPPAAQGRTRRHPQPRNK